ncbi:MAG: family 16 glycoside hydrolase [Candidatus Brocadiia bacterium]
MRTSLAVLGIAIVSASALADDPSWYVKKAAWEETLEASQRAWEQARKERPPAPPLPDLGKSDFSILAWLRTRHGGTLVAKAPAEGKWAPQGKSLFVRDGRPTLDVGWVGAVRSERAVADGRWHHVAAVKQGDALRFFVDGEPAGGGRLEFGPDPASAVVKLGFTNPNFPRPSPLRGDLDDVRLFRRALSPQEVRAHAEKLQPPKGEGLVACWPFDGGLADATGEGHDARAVGELAFVEGRHGKALRLGGEAHAVVGGPASIERELWALLERDFGVVRLFDGQSLAGWRPRNRPGHGWGAVWSVADGALQGVQEWPGSWGMVAARRAFADADLRLEVRTDWPLDAAVLLRESGFARAYQVALHCREDGDVGGIATHKTGGPSVPAEGWRKLWKKDDWNQLRIVVQGEPPTIRTWLNGHAVAAHTFAQTPDLVEPRGPIALTITGGPEAFNNRLRVRKAVLLPPP